jgi:four helix bundle protein
MLPTTRTFRELFAWQRAHQFVLKTYISTSTFPREEMYGLTSQFRRAAISIPANIAEGYAKRGQADKKRFFNIAQGSLEECRYYLILARDLKLISGEELDFLLEEVSKLLTSYIRAISESHKK